jgi:hypothetical protein
VHRILQPLRIMRLLILIFLFFPSSVFAQFGIWPQGNMLAFVFANTNDPIIGKSCNMDFYNVTNELPIIAKAANLNLEMHSFSGERFSFDELERTLSNLKPQGLSTTIFLYIATHGMRLPGDTTELPNIKLPRKGIPYINAAEVHKFIKSRIQNQLMITIIDACNNQMNLSKQYVEVISRNYSHDFSGIITNREIQFYRQLFRWTKGDLIVTSSQPNFNAVGTNNGGVFTNCLLESLEYFSDAKPDAKWGDVLAQAKSLTEKETEELSKQDPTIIPHFPVWQDGLKPNYPQFGYGRRNPDEPTVWVSCMTKKLSPEERKQRGITDSLLVKVAIAATGYPTIYIVEILKEVNFQIRKQERGSDKFELISLKGTNPQCNFCQEFTTNVRFVIKAEIVYKNDTKSVLDVMYY